MVQVKICGLSEPQGVAAAILGGASFLGFVFFPKSPRNVAPEQAARLIEGVPAHIRKVGLFVDPTDGQLCDVLAACPLDLIQLHGEETPERALEIKTRFAKPLIKALPISHARDFERVGDYEPLADYLLFDAKPPKGAERPGGNAQSFDWRLLAGRSFARPWMLAGGIEAANLVQALSESGARLVDVSSGVEDAPGQKSPEKIRAFLELAASL
jgi:phosphoribosylanthranilate isomerase